MIRFVKALILSLISLIFLWLAGFLFFVGYTQNIKPEIPLVKTDAVIVLTGGERRIETGLELLALGMTDELFISGVHPDVSIERIRALSKGSIPLPECCITLGHQATSTIQNAEETRQWLANREISTIRLVTSNYHIPRALIELSTLPRKITIIPHPVSEPNLKVTSQWFWSLMIEEYHKAIYRAARLIMRDRQ